MLFLRQIIKIYNFWEIKPCLFLYEFLNRCTSCWSLITLSCGCCLCTHLPGGALGRYVQRKLSSQNIFEQPFVSVRENLRTGITICEQWVVDCEHLTGQVCQSFVCSLTPHFYSLGQNVVKCNIWGNDISSYNIKGDHQSDCSQTCLTAFFSGVEEIFPKPLEGKQALPSNASMPCKKIRWSKRFWCRFMQDTQWNIFSLFYMITFIHCIKYLFRTLFFCFCLFIYSDTSK